MTYKKVFNALKTAKVDDVGKTKTVNGFYLHIYDHKMQVNICDARSGLPLTVIMNYNDDEVKYYHCHNGITDYSHPSRIYNINQELNDIPKPLTDILFG